MNENRDSFADEQAYIAHRRHLASLARSERLGKNAIQPKRVRIKDSPALQTWQRMKKAARARDYRQMYPERARAARYRWEDRNPDKVRAQHKRHYRRHHEEILLQKAIYRLDNYQRVCDAALRYREQHREEARQRSRRWREENPERYASQLAVKRSSSGRHRHALRERERRQQGNDSRVLEVPYRSRSSIRAATAEFEQQVVLLRDEGWTFREIGELTGRKANTCKQAYYSVMKRNQLDRQQSA